MSLLGTTGRKLANTILAGAIAITSMAAAPTALANSVAQPQAGAVATQNIDIYQTYSQAEWLYSCKYFRLWYCGPRRG